MENYGKLHVSWAQGYKGDDLHHVDTDNICYVCGSTVKFIDVVNKTESTFFSEGKGVKTVATNPFQNVFAIAEHGLKPRIFVYHFPSMEKAGILSDGAELEYTNIAFSATNSLLVACSGVPDFTLYLWNWSNGELKCKEKLLSEESITSVMFNPLNHNQISLIGPQKVSVWTLESCSNVSTFNSKKVVLPTTDGVIPQEDDNLTARSVTRLGYASSIPSVIKAGLYGDDADLFVPPHLRRPLVEPTAQCWSSRGEVFVGCKGGQLFRVDGDSGRSTLILGGPSDAILKGKIEPGMFSCMAYNSQGIISGGKDNYFRQFIINNNGIAIDQLWKAAQAPQAMTFNPKTYSELYYGTDGGTIYKYELAQPESVIVSETHCSKFVGVAYGAYGKFCLTCREDGDVQVWDSDDGDLYCGTQLNDEATSMAFCPSSPVLAVGSKTGKIRYVDTSNLHSDEIDVRQIYCQKIHHGSVDFLKYDIYGTFLLSASKEESQIFVFNSTPSSRFNCIGYVDCEGLIRDLSVFPDGDKLLVTATTAFRHDPNMTNEVVVFTLTADLLKEEEHNYNSLRKDFKRDVINLSRYTLTMSIDSAVITASSDVIELAAISHHNKTLHKFNLLPNQGMNSEEVYAPISHHPGHQLGGGKLVLSPHKGWLGSTSKDGAIMIRDLKNWNSCISITPHSFLENGTRDFVFSPDSKFLLSVGAQDDSLCCIAWEFSEKGSIVANSAVEFSRGLNMKLRSTIEKESDVLDEMTDWVSPAASDERTRGSSFQEEDKREEAEGEAQEDGANAENIAEGALDAAKREEVEGQAAESDDNMSDKTWLDVRMEIALKHENSKYDQETAHLREEIAKLRNTILEMMDINSDLPELEQLKHEEFNLDIEEQKRMQAEQNKEIQQVRDEINLENLAQRYLAYLIKKECWDDMETKGRALKTFSHTTTVHNYPLVPITSAEETLLQCISQLRKIEIAEYAVRKSIVDSSASKTSGVGEEEEDEEDDQNVGLALHGSLGPKFNGESDLFYSQFELHTREEKMIQIVLIKNAIRRVKEAFNETFNSVFKNKEQEIVRIKERNVRIRTIMKELGIDAASVVDPAMDKDETPEKGFDVADHEVKVDRVLSEKQQREKEDQERLEEERKAAAKGDNKRERALMDMMGGVLEVKKEDILKQDIPPPDFAQEKAEKDWTEDEKKKMKEHEKKLKELTEEREKYRKNLENELKKLQQSNIDAMSAYDDSLAGLFNKKVKVEMVINQEELKILRLTNSLITDDELSTYETHLNFLLELKNAVQAKATAIEGDIRKKVDDYREFYDGVVAEDKMLDRGFKRDFSDIPLSLSDQLYKLFRRRPRIQRHHKHPDEESITYDPFGLLDKSTASSQGGDNAALRQGLVELDHHSHIPDGVDEHLWQRLCDSRRAKFESELRAKQCAMTLAEMTQYLQHRQEELEKLTREIDDVIKQQSKLYEDMMKNTLNLEVQLLLKQGQVEVPISQFIPDYSESILIHRGVVEDLNGTIRTLGESKVAAMTESKDFKKGIHQLEWERKRMTMQMEDLHNKARHVQMLKLTKEIQAFLNEENHSAKQAKEIAVLEQTLVLQDKQLEANLDHKNEITSQIARRLRMKEEENNELDKVLEELHISVSERQNISDVNAVERAMNTADKRLRGIVQRRKLVDLAKAQAQEVAVLRAEVERLRMKTFPALVQVER